MNSDLQHLEASLKEMHPTTLDRDLLDRLELACEDQLAELSAPLKATEAALKNAAPAQLPASFAARAETILSRVSYTRHSKLLPFAKPSTQAPTRQPKPSKFPSLAVAAAVAICGAAIPLFLNPPQDTPKTTKTSHSPQPSLHHAEPLHQTRSAFSPAKFSSNVHHTNDLGVVWAQDQRPLRVVKIIYMDETKLLNEQGEEIITEIPRVEYILVPEKID